jgi:hypothetical protein
VQCQVAFALNGLQRWHQARHSRQPHLLRQVGNREKASALQALVNPMNDFALPTRQ